MKRPKRNDKSVLLNLPVPIIHQIDEYASVLSVTRTQFLRQSVERNLQYFAQNELPIALRMKRFTETFDDMPSVFTDAA
tara:strand:- start:2803 stop:3039 length:237 start_codon:yes stop_codon:yes gene_type:complete